MQPKIEKTIPDHLERLEQLWPHLEAWQRSIILARALIYAAHGHARQNKQAHWVKAPYYWI